MINITVCNRNVFVYPQVNGIDISLQNGDININAVNQGVAELQFEEEDEEQFYMKDLPKHACA